jgi:hypothetical protein
MNTNRLSVIGGSILIILIIVLGYMLGISPKLAEGDAISAQQQTVDSDNVTQQAALDALRLKYSKIGELRAQYAALQTAIPLTANSPDFVDQVKSLADANGVTVTAMTIAEPAAVVLPVATAASSTAAPEASASAAPTSSPAAVPAATSAGAAAGKALVGRLFFSAVHITVLGSSAQVFGFENALQQGQRLFLSDQVAATAAGASPGGTISGYLLIVPPASSTAAAK